MGYEREGRTPKGTWGVHSSCLCALIFILSACSDGSRQSILESEGLMLPGSMGDGAIGDADIHGGGADTRIGGEVTEPVPVIEAVSATIPVAEYKPLPDSDRLSEAQPEPNTTPEMTVEAPSLSFSSSETLIDQGSGVVLSWTATGATGCNAGGGWSGARSTSGNAFVGDIGSSTTFSLTCTGPGGNVVEMLTVNTLSSVSLNWVAPSENVDGTPLMDLAGYRIYYGTTSRDYSGMEELTDPYDTSHTLSLASGDYYVAMTAFDREGNESAYSNEVVKTAP